MIRMSVATVTASLAAKISLCAVRVYNHHLGWHKGRCNHSIKPAPEALMLQNGEPRTRSSGLNWNMEKSTMFLFMEGGNTITSQSQQENIPSRCK